MQGNSVVLLGASDLLRKTGRLGSTTEALPALCWLLLWVRERERACVMEGPGGKVIKKSVWSNQKARLECPPNQPVNEKEKKKERKLIRGNVGGESLLQMCGRA